ncbi:hypothetical protein [Mesomycoplasma molare]|uniref:Uncharacterized protein n=1 Tax=Mesomycoplasma molare TaxID=171288 RepID=A0ABY5TUB7_9BACT|nr:hypothetical protein [Mesomycoplasma molare]UWD34257.1 hypothetical protein NX772_00275 [Mesomycoplasma molare]
MEKNKILSLLDVNFKNKLKNISLDINRGEDVLIFSSDPELHFTFVDLLIFKNKKYSGVIKIGKSFLKKKNSDFWIPEKVLNIFSNKNKKYYFEKPLFEVMKRSLETNEFNYKLMNDFRKDWKEVSEEYHFYIKEEEEKFSTKLYEHQILIFQNFFNSINYEKLYSEFNKNKIQIELIDDYIDKRIKMLNLSLNNITFYEIEKYKVYLKYQEKFRKQEGQLQNLKKELEIAENEVKNFENTSEFNLHLETIKKEYKNLSQQLNEKEKLFKYGFWKDGFYTLVCKSLKLKIKEVKKELKIAFKSKNKDNVLKAKILLWIRKKTYSLFKKNKKDFKYLTFSYIKGFYQTIKDFETEFFNDVFFDFKRNKKIQWNNQLLKIEQFHEKKFTLNKLRILNEKRKKEIQEEILILKAELAEKQKTKIEGSKSLDEVDKHKKIDIYWEKQANYIWEKDKNIKSLTEIIDLKTQNNNKLEEIIIQNIIKVTRLDKFIFKLLKKKYAKKFKITKEKQNKIKSLMLLARHAYAIYHPLSFVYTKNFEDNKIIQNVIIKNELFNFLKNIKIDVNKLWIPFSDLKESDKIKIDIGKLKLYSPEIVLVNLNKTIFGSEYIDELVRNKDKNTSLLIFSNNHLESQEINNFIFIEKGKIIESTFGNKNREFESLYAQNFMESKSFNLSLLDKISPFEYEEIYFSRKNTKINHSDVYIYDSDLKLSEVINSRKNNQKTQKEYNYNIDLEDTVIIDLTDEFNIK